MNIPTLQEGDWMQVNRNSFYAGAIRYVCNSITSHGQPLHYYNGQFVVLDAKFPVMKVTAVEKAYQEDDFFICRQQIIDHGQYISNVNPLLEDMAKKKPYYNICGVVKIFFTLALMSRYYNKIKNAFSEESKDLQIYSRDIKRFICRHRNNITSKIIDLETYDDEINKLYQKHIEQTTYCTQIWHTMWKKNGIYPFKELYNAEFATPAETERLGIDRCTYIDGMFKGQQSTGVWDLTKQHWQTL